MKPLTQFEKMRANRARRTAIEREILHQARLQQWLRSTSAPIVQASEPYFGRPLNNLKGSTC